MTVYLAFIQDRHSDTDCEVFTTPAAAIAYAREFAHEYGFPEDYEEREVKGWLFYASYSVESDCVWVVEKELKS